jgi:hypothetical protein
MYERFENYGKRNLNGLIQQLTVVYLQLTVQLPFTTLSRELLIHTYNNLQ